MHQSAGQDQIPTAAVPRNEPAQACLHCEAPDAPFTDAMRAHAAIRTREQGMGTTSTTASVLGRYNACLHHSHADAQVPARCLCICYVKLLTGGSATDARVPGCGPMSARRGSVTPHLDEADTAIGDDIHISLRCVLYSSFPLRLPPASAPRLVSPHDLRIGKPHALSPAPRIS